MYVQITDLTSSLLTRTINHSYTQMYTQIKSVFIKM